jgi:hypothetical protein
MLICDHNLKCIFCIFIFISVPFPGRQCCQVVYFQAKNPNLGKVCKVLQWKTLVFSMANLSILRPNGIFYGRWVHFVVIWHILPVLDWVAEKNLATRNVKQLGWNWFSIEFAQTLMSRMEMRSERKPFFLPSGLPDLSWHNLTKHGKYLPNSRKINRMAPICRCHKKP